MSDSVQQDSQSSGREGAQVLQLREQVGLMGGGKNSRERKQSKAVKVWVRRARVVVKVILFLVGNDVVWILLFFN
jgi:hypothetical protein